MVEEYRRSTVVSSKMLLSRMASWNAAVRMWILWFVGGRRRLVAVREIGEVGEPSLLLRVASRLRMWLNGLQQIEQFYCVQQEVLVQVRGGSWRGVSFFKPRGVLVQVQGGSWQGVSVSVSVLVLVLVLVSAAGSMLSLSRLI